MIHHDRLERNQGEAVWPCTWTIQSCPSIQNQLARADTFSAKEVLPLVQFEFLGCRPSNNNIKVVFKDRTPSAQEFKADRHIN